MTRKKMLLALALVLVLGAVLLVSKPAMFRIAGGLETPLCPGCNVIVILVDTLRADHLPCYGYERDTAPNICVLAEDGILFKNMYSNSPSTKTSVASLFTSMLPSQHKSIHNDDVLSDDFVTMAEILTEHGYHAYAVNGNPVIKSEFNYGQGFSTWTDNIKRVMQRNPVVLDSLGSHEQPFFLYLHFMDPHSPYSAPGSFFKYFNPDYDGDVTGAGPYEVEYFEDRPDELEQLTNFYDNEIRFVDHKIGEVFNRLKEIGLYEDTLFILLSDHGDMFLEHGQFEHSNGVYTELIDVPLIIRPPNHEKVVVDTPIQTIDILPTLLSMLGIEVEHKFMGRSIFPLIGSDEARPIISEQRRMCCGRTRFAETALIVDDYKLIRQLTKPNVHLLFDMANDPLEQENLINSAQDATQLIDQMDSLIDENASVYEGFEAKKITLDDETTQQLKELGYIR